MRGPCQLDLSKGGFSATIEEWFNQSRLAGFLPQCREPGAYFNV
jgi:hypothetical protein